MKANPGGTIGPKEVVGRDELIQQLWQILECQSVVLTSQRRVGKTTVIKKMREEPPARGLLCVLHDLEGLRSPQEFVECLYQDVKGSLSRADRARLQLPQLLSKLGGAEIGDIKLPHLTQHWKRFLSALVADLCQCEDRTVIFFWDELPLFLHDVKASGGEHVAMEMLDVLRSLRQQHKQLRMVFTGSVGLHLVVKELRQKRYANAPTNDMRIVEVPPLAPKHAARLARLLLDGEALCCTGEPAQLAGRIAEVAGHIPFYIHWLVARLKAEGATVQTETVEEQFNALIADPDDPADFDYFRRRLRSYYQSEEEAVAVAALDAVALADVPLGFAVLLNLIRHEIPSAEEEAVREVLRLLEKDHYFHRTPGTGAYQFRSPVVLRWWRYSRG